MSRLRGRIHRRGLGLNPSFGSPSNPQATGRGSEASRFIAYRGPLVPMTKETLNDA
jgi:hypothetical protein